MRSLVSLALALSSGLIFSCTPDPVSSVPSCEGDQCDDNGTALQVTKYMYRADDTLSHHFPTTYTDHPMPSVGSESCRNAELRLFLINDNAHSYTLQYEEQIPVDGSTSGCRNYDVDIEKTVTGTWDVVDNALHLSGLGVAEAVTISGSQELSLQVDNNIGSPGLTSGPVLLEVVTSSWGLEECSGAFYDANLCPIDI